MKTLNHFLIFKDVRLGLRMGDSIDIIESCTKKQREEEYH